MKRRNFLAITGIGGAATLLAVKLFPTSFEDAVTHLIKNELSFLKLDEKGLRQFAGDFAKRNKDRVYRLTLQGYSFLNLTASQSGKINQLVSTYLLSTDFFTQKMNEARIVKYVGLYDPYLRPCAHPFSHFMYPDNNSMK